MMMIMTIICIVNILLKINKYECRTGPFEGFFVSSVEFCKHIKFDKDKDDRDRDNNNQTGTQGSTRSGHKVHQELMEPMVKMEPKVHQAHKAHQELMAHKVHKVKEDLMEHKVHLEPLE